MEAHTQAFRENIRRSTESILAAGEEACAIKRILRRKGQFSIWVQNETPCSIDTVERYMNAFRRFGSKQDLAVRLGITDLCDLAAPRVSDELVDFIFEELARDRRFERGEISRLINDDTKEVSPSEKTQGQVASVDRDKAGVALLDARVNNSVSTKEINECSNNQEALMVRIIVECFKDEPEDFLSIYDASDCREVLPKVADELRLIVEETT